MEKGSKKYRDKEILEGLRFSDSQVIEYVYQEFYPMIYKHIIANKGNKADARDIFQDGIMVLYKKSLSPDFKLTAGIGTFLFSICKNLWLNKLNRQKSKEHLKEKLPEEVDNQDFLNEANNERQHLLQRLFRKIGESCRNILLKKYFENLKDIEIADELNLSGADYVKTQRYRCLKQLKKLYSEMKMI
jgi:RNA polymerase sigma factor (sigma-70 family)